MTSLSSTLRRLNWPLRTTLALAASLVLTASQAFAGTFYVDAANSKATDTGNGAGASNTPYKTIQAAVTAKGTQSNTIIVKPAVYRETVTMSASGASGKLVILQASAAGVIVSGADDFSATAKWTLVGGNV